MPHVNIKHWPRTFTDEEKSNLVESLTETVTRIFGCAPGAVSIVVEQVEQSRWPDVVYAPEIDGRPDLLWKRPGYSIPASTTDGTP